MRSDVYKNDLFTLGMILLGVVSLKDCHDCYDIYNGSINSEKLAKRLEDLEGHYSELTMRKLRHMVELQEERRRDFKKF
jgi:hypothetical protein